MMPKQVPRYPKTQSLWKRDMEAEGHGKGLIMPGQYVMEEFESIEKWHFTEKIHGQNIRIGFHNNDLGIPKEVSFWGRRAGESSVNKYLLPRLKEYFTVELLQDVFPVKERGMPVDVVLYGEGYGDKIQSWHYGLEDEQSFILFDVLIGNTWLTQDAVTQLAIELGVERVPVLYEGGQQGLAVAMCRQGFESRVCPGHPAEGIVARSHPLVLHRHKKNPIMWKLKCEDYRKLKQFKLTGMVTKSETWGL